MDAGLKALLWKGGEICVCKRFFVVSDIHGHYTQLKQALDAAGFDAKNSEHVFLCCGDLFDRGPENLRVYDFVRGLERKILIRGNHEDILEKILKQGSLTENGIANGTHLTLPQLLGEGVMNEYGELDVAAYAEKIRALLAFLDSMTDYYETPRYVFVHGWVPSVVEGRHAYVRQDWRAAGEDDWQFARWLGWQEMYAAGAMLPGKTVVCGHRPARMGENFDPDRERDCSEPFYGEGVIAIDAGTVRSQRVNVLVLEEGAL